MKKGFTLIELLAVIVILAIIAIIAVPIVVNIIKDSKESAIFRSAEFYIDGVENAIASSLLHNKQIKDGTYYIMQEGNICLGTYDNEDNTCDGDILEIQVKGDKPTSGTITIKDGEIDKVILNISDKEIIFNSNGEFDYYLAPGLYDENNKLLSSWDELVDKYNIKNVIEQGVDYNGDYSVYNILQGYDNASKLVIDESVTSISASAFDSCDSLESIIIPDSVTSIGYEAFQECTSLISITIPNSVISIGDSAFLACENLTTIRIGSSLTSIDKNVFHGTKLTSIVVDENNPVYDSRDNSNAIIHTATNTLIVGSNNTVIPDSVTSIENYAFEDCTNLKEIIIPNSVTSIGEGAFYGCTNLTTVTIPNSVTSIDSYAFYGCTNLKEITIPNSVTRIEYETFQGCTGLTSITIPNSVTRIDLYAFSGCTNLKTIYYKGTATGSPWGAHNATVIR